MKIATQDRQQQKCRHCLGIPNFARSIFHPLHLALIFMLMCVNHPTPALAQTPAPTPPPVLGTPILKEDFESEFINDPLASCGSELCKVPKNWGVWFLSRKDTDAEGINFQPQYDQTRSPKRVKSGLGAQRVFVENKTFTGGIYRAITGLTPGAKIRFTAYGQMWSTNDDSILSARPSRDIKLKIGIDPTGGDAGRANPLNGQVVWSAEQDARDDFKPFSVEIEAKASTILVYTSATMRDVVRHNEVYWDDMLIEVLNASAAPIQPTTPAQANVTRSVTGIKHVVKEGDSLASIAQRYNKTTEEIRQLNRLSNDRLALGQELTIELPAGALPSQPITTTTATSGTVSAPTYGIICVLAYYDNNGSGKRDRTEDLVPLVPFNVSLPGTNQIIFSHVTDGVNEPKCFLNVQSGIPYIVAASITPNYNATTVLNAQVNVPSSGQVDFYVGLRKVSDGNADKSKPAAPSTNTTSVAPNLASILTTAIGALLLFVIVIVIVTLFLRRRRL